MSDQLANTMTCVAITAAVTLLGVGIVGGLLRKLYDTSNAKELSGDTVQLQLHMSQTLIWLSSRFLSIFLVSQLLRLIPRDRVRDFAIEIYIWASTGLLVWFFVQSVSGSRDGVLSIAVVTLFAFYRLVEMLVAAVDVLTGKIVIHAAPGVTLVLIYLAQTLLCFTLLAGIYGKFAEPDISGDGLPHAARLLFMIWGYITTIGSSNTPLDWMSVTLVMVAGIYSLMLLGVFLAHAIGRIQPSLPPPDPGQSPGA
jgi:hypothetical protein